MPFTKGDPNINRNGRPKRKTLTELIHAKLDDDPKQWEKIVAMVIEKLLKDKNDQVLKTFWEYTDGKPMQRSEITGKDGEELKGLIIVKDGSSTK